jgi:hypothetical protein
MGRRNSKFHSTKLRNCKPSNFDIESSPSILDFIKIPFYNIIKGILLNVDIDNILSLVNSVEL